MTAVLDDCRTGTVVGVEDHGSIVMLRAVSDDGETFFVPFDHSPMRWLLDGEGCGLVDLLGREIGYDGEVLWFLDDEENE